jgi:pyridoxamine 5'-phosphate oxidase
MRKTYGGRKLHLDSVPDEPFSLFGVWFADSVNTPEVAEANAMILSTVDASQQPRARTVLLKEWSEDGFVFYTNYNSDKAHELESNPRASLTWLWLPLERQVRVEGVTSRISPEVSDEYFASRPRESQLGAWASNQSQAVDSRAVLEQRFAEAKARFSGEEIPRPPHWGGLRVSPTLEEFWQGRDGRMHDRIVYRRDDEKSGWTLQRLMP